MIMILTKKNLQGIINKELEDSKKEIEKLKKTISNKEFQYLEERDKYKDKSEKLEEVNKEHQNLIVLRENSIKELETTIKNLKEQNRKLNNGKGGFIKKIHELEEKVNEANIKLSQRFILKEIPNKIGRPRKTQVMKTKSNTINSKIIKKMKEE